MTATPAEAGPGPGGSTEDRRRREEERHADQDRTLAAMQQLEAALGAAVPHREQAWLTEVRRALAVLAEAASEEADNTARPDSLLSDISRTQPWLRNRVRGLRIHYGQLRDGITALGSELGGQAGETVDFTDIRQRLAWVLGGLRHQRARESDLIYEARLPYRPGRRHRRAARPVTRSGSRLLPPATPAQAGHASGHRIPAGAPANPRNHRPAQRPGEAGASGPAPPLAACRPRRRLTAARGAGTTRADAGRCWCPAARRACTTSARQAPSTGPAASQDSTIPAAGAAPDMPRPRRSDR